MSYSSLFLYPFQKELISFDLLRAPLMVVDVEHEAAIDAHKPSCVVQNYKYRAQPWIAKNYEVDFQLPQEKTFQTIFCQMPQSKEYCYYQLAMMISLLDDDGVLVCMAGNNENGKRLKKWFLEFGLSAQSTSKQKHQIVWAQKKKINSEYVNQCIDKYGIQKVKIKQKEFYTKAGIYGWNKIDSGSQLLIDTMPPNIKGFGADYGCGYGFLSKSVVHLNPTIEMIDLYDADSNALECAGQNMKDMQCQVNLFFKDLVNNKVNKKYDWIIMNPPFHAGKKADADIGVKFIENAAGSLKLGGMLYMVANVFLPYEKTLAYNFSKVETVKEENGFKVIFAQK